MNHKRYEEWGTAGNVIPVLSNLIGGTYLWFLEAPAAAGYQIWKEKQRGHQKRSWTWELDQTSSGITTVLWQQQWLLYGRRVKTSQCHFLLLRLTLNTDGDGDTFDSEAWLGWIVSKTKGRGLFATAFVHQGLPWCLGLTWDDISHGVDDCVEWMQKLEKLSLGQVSNGLFI